jgi:hypothetical protein
MPPKKTSEPPLNVAEIKLVDSAARIFTGVKYKEAHQEFDEKYFQMSLGTEMVRPINLLFNILIRMYCRNTSRWSTKIIHRKRGSPTVFTVPSLQSH